MKWNMKRFVRTCAVWGSRLGAAVVAVLGVDRCEAQIPIVRENQTVAAVVIPASPNVSERLAAEAMVTYLTMAGTRPTVISDDVDVPRPAISIGRTETGLYDGKFGYIDDPLHPLVIAGREDTSWNPQWQHAWHIDPGRRRWTVELAVPFASLGESTPVPGQRWRFNVGRERHPGNFRGGTPSMFPDLYLWSPNLESQLFCVPAIFGDLHFDRNAMP